MELTAASQKVLSFWLRSRADNLVPPHDALHLEELEDRSASILYCEWQADDHLKVLLTGSNVVAAVGVDMTGHDLLGSTSPDVRDEAISFLKAVGQTPCVAKSVNATNSRNGVPLEFEFVYLPISFHGENTRILCSLNALEVDFRISDVGEGGNVAGFRRAAFIDIGNGTPDVEGIQRFNLSDIDLSAAAQLQLI